MQKYGPKTIDDVAVIGSGFAIALRGDLGAFVTPAEDQPAPRRLGRPTFERDVPTREMYGRRDELHAAVTALVTHRVICVQGPPGSGKTEFLARLAFDPSFKHAFPSGIIHLGIGRGWSARDLASFLVDALYENEGTYVKHTDAEVRRLLASERLLVFIDDVDPGLKMRELRIAAPNARFVLGVGNQVPSDCGGAVVRLGPVDEEAATALLLAELGGVCVDQMRDVAALIAALDGNPGRITQLAALRRTTRKSLHELAAALTSADRLDEVRAYEIAFTLDERARTLLHAVAAYGPTATRSELALADRLETLGLLVPVRGGHTIATGVNATLERGLRLGGELDRAEQFRPRAHFGVEVSDRIALSGMLSVSRRNNAMGRHAQAVFLGRETADALARIGAWDAWDAALDEVKAGARERADKEAEAWALNATGVRALAVGEADLAAGAFVQCLDLRRRLKNEPAVRITEHNLRLAMAPARVRITAGTERRLFAFG